MKKIFLILLALVLALSVGVVGCTAPAEEEEEEEEEPEVITLKFGTVAPETFGGVAEVILPWQEKITDETNGVIQWENYFGTLVSPTDCYAEIQTGLVDIGNVMTSYEPTGFAIAKMISIFFVGSLSMETNLAVLQDLAETFPEIEAEFSGMKVLENGTTGPPWNLLTTEEPIYSLEDLAGLQIKSMTWQMPMLEALGATGVPMNMFDVYPSLETGVLDGAIATTETLKSLNLADVINYHTDLNIASGAGYTLGMNWDTWNGLPLDIQQVFEDNMQYYSDLYVEMWGDMTTEGIAAGALAGVEFIELAQEELEELHSLLRETAAAEAATLDDMGLPGTDIYTEAQRLIAEYQS